MRGELKAAIRMAFLSGLKSLGWQGSFVEIGPRPGMAQCRRNRQQRRFLTSDDFGSGGNSSEDGIPRIHAFRQTVRFDGIFAERPVSGNPPEKLEPLAHRKRTACGDLPEGTDKKSYARKIKGQKIVSKDLH